MKSHLALPLLVAGLSPLWLACSSSSPAPAQTTSNDGGGGGAGGGTNNGSAAYASGSLSGGLVATLKDIEVAAVGGMGQPATAYAGGLTVGFMDMDSISFTVPTGATGSLLSVQIVFASLPATGTYTEKSAGLCGSASVAPLTSSPALIGTPAFAIYEAEAKACINNPSNPPPAGSWTLSLTSLSPIGTNNGANPMLITSYSIHGTFDATMVSVVDGATTATLHLDF